MGKIKQGILGGFSNKVGTVVGSSWKGIAVMRSMPLSVANPRTTAQVANRSSFAAISRFGAKLLSYAVQPNFNPQAKYMSGFNMFQKINKDLLDEEGQATWERTMVLAKGELSCIMSSVSVNFSTGVLTCEFATTGQNAKDQSSDLLKAVIIGVPNVTHTIDEILVYECPLANDPARRRDGYSDFRGVGELPEDYKYYAKVWFISADGKRTSNTLDVALV